MDEDPFEKLDAALKGVEERKAAAKAGVEDHKAAFTRSAHEFTRFRETLAQPALEQVADYLRGRGFNVRIKSEDGKSGDTGYMRITLFVDHATGDGRNVEQYRFIVRSAIPGEMVYFDWGTGSSSQNIARCKLSEASFNFVRDQAIDGVAAALRSLK